MAATTDCKKCPCCGKVANVNWYKHNRGEYHIEVNVAIGPEPYESDRDFVGVEAFMCGCGILFFDPEGIP